MQFKKIIKNITPKAVLNLRHFFYAWLGAVVFNHPSEELFVIGVTGTSGKSTIVYLLRQMLENAGLKVGALSTIEFYVNGQSKLNDKKMTMLGKMEIQKYLRQMADAGSEVAIIETTSEGAAQYRHKFINYDAIILTNLYPEHIESHGSFANYKKAKLEIFEHVSKCGKKTLPKKDGIKWPEKLCIVNNESEYKNEFLNFNFDSKVIFGQGGEFTPLNTKVVQDGLHFSLYGKEFEAVMYGEYNVANICAVIALARSLGIDWDTIVSAVNNFHNAPGRVEFIREAEKYGFKAIVDYAFEPVAMQELYKVVKLLNPNRIVHVFGATGGGRDKKRRATMGDFIGKNADICVITNEDPYDDDPMEIINEVAEYVSQTGKVANENMFKILDRGEAIKKAIDFAKKNDVILVTGKGSEQAIVAKGALIPWDDREEVRKSLIFKK